MIISGSEAFKEAYKGGINGFNEFNPDNIVEHPFTPPIIFTDFKLFNKNVPITEEGPLKQHINYTEELVLSHDQSIFSLDFAALNYTINEKKKYAYILEGFEKI